MSNPNVKSKLSMRSVHMAWWGTLFLPIQKTKMTMRTLFPKICDGSTGNKSQVTEAQELEQMVALM